MCARVTNLAGVDLNLFRFDYDLTFAVLLMNADGTIYHVYGGRDWTDPMSHLSMDSLVKVLTETLDEHDKYQRNPNPPKRKPKRTIEEIPPLARAIKGGKKIDCFHCHMVFENEIRDLVETKNWSRDKAWLYPDPVQVGLRLDRDHQQKIVEVVPKSPAARAKLKPGDVLLTLCGQNVRTFGDIQRHLHEHSASAGSCTVTYSRGGEERTKLHLPKNWKEATPLVYSWRASKWPIPPMPGFGGKPLDQGELKAAGLDSETFAFRVGYLVTWGHNRRTGQNAHRAGIRKGDIVHSVSGKNDFRDMHHFHSWFRLTHKPGEEVEIALIRKGRRKKIRLPVIE